MSILSLHFAEPLAEIERRLARGQDPARAFHGVDDDLFALLCSKDYPGRESLKAALPDYPPVEWVQDCTGNMTLFESVKEAVQFWGLAKAAYARHARRRPPLSRATVVDYGAGWGRITRFCAKDAGKVYAVEPNDTFHELFTSCGVPGELVKSHGLSSDRLPIRKADLLFCFSIVTHSSDLLTRNIAERWAETMAPGGVVVFTIRPGTMFDMDGGEIDRLPAEERAAMRADYEQGRLAYWPYPGSPDWGITLAPMAYLREVFARHFDIVGPHYFLQNHTQLPVVMVRR
jgi:hypothetical protein